MRVLREDATRSQRGLQKFKCGFLPRNCGAKNRLKKKPIAGYNFLDYWQTHVNWFTAVVALSLTGWFIPISQMF